MCIRDRYETLKKEIPLSYYEGMYPHMNDGGIMIDDCNHHEFEDLMADVKPDLVFAGVRDKYISHKLGVASKQLHAYDYSGPFAGYNGALIFARDVAHALLTPSWKMIIPPWEQGKTSGSEPHA